MTRSLPDFLVIGAAKSGTTSLYAWLASHPQVIPAFRKEVYFFDRTYHRGLLWYRAFFPTVFAMRRRSRDLGNRVVTGEATPCYLFHPLAPARVRGTLPGVRLIALLRNPVERAVSYYWQQVRRGYETLPFDEAIRREGDRLRGEDERMIEDERYFSVARDRYSYLARGRYAEQLERWLGCFPREQLLVLTTDELALRPQDTFDRVAEFLGLGRASCPERKVHFRSDYPPLDEPTRRRLAEHFREPNRRLFGMFGIDAPWNDS